MISSSKNFILAVKIEKKCKFPAQILKWQDIINDSIFSRKVDNPAFCKIFWILVASLCMFLWHAKKNFLVIFLWIF